MLTGVGEAGAPRHCSGTSLHHALLSTVEAGQGGAVRCLLGLIALLTGAPQPPQGCLVAWWLLLSLEQDPFSTSW